MLLSAAVTEMLPPNAATSCFCAVVTTSGWITLSSIGYAA